MSPSTAPQAQMERPMSPKQIFEGEAPPLEVSHGPTVPQAMGELNDAVTQLEECVGTLVARLAPVLTPFLADVSPPMETPGASCEVAQAARCLAARINAIGRTVNELRHRLAL